ncbi:MAG TPA: flagellar biosynthesis protein FlhA [Phycisphaerales bacterium]|nr:flagellar biosynthesis protein FlhA [Phycisphaerales bacterium]
MAKPLPQPAAPNVPSWMVALKKYRGLIIPISFVFLLGVVLVPLPPMVMDVLICLNIALSMVIIMTTIYMKEPLDFSVFPSLLLATTLFRLVLNVASTRLILSADAQSADQALDVAGHVISAFGSFVAGKSLVVGVILFLILVIVQFIVITKGATRIAEVAARFTLDAMPGKQLAIDADLNAGVINEAEARRRRERIAHEADFFGAMDGASKFVRGDAIAGIIITAINILGGIAIGVLEKGWPIGQTMEVFTKLTIGEGLTAQIPAFIIAIASALIVTRSGSKAELGDEMTQQVMGQPTGLFVTAAFLALLSLTPLPTIPLLVTSGGIAAIGWGLLRSQRQKVEQQKAAAAASGPGGAGGKPEAASPESLLKLDAMELEVGYGLVPLVDTAQGGDLLERISAIRRQTAADLGVIMPPVRIRDNLQLPAHEYRLKIKGAVVARGQTIPGQLLAIDSGISSGPLDGTPAKEPAFGLDAWWIDAAQKTRAETMNYTVVDPTSVLATHLTEVVKTYSAELLSRQEVTELVAQLKTKAPKLVEEVLPTVVKTADLHRVLQNLLRERIPIRDMETIVETLADWMPKTKDTDVLTEYVRNGLRRSICQLHSTTGENGKPRIVCITLDPSLEDFINGYIDRSAAGTSLTMPASVATHTAEQIVRGLQQVTAAGHHPVVLASPTVRAVVRQIIEPHMPSAAVLGYNEIVQGVEVESLALITHLPVKATAHTPQEAAA